MVQDLATPWSELNISLQSTLEENRRLTEDVMSWAIEYLGKVEGNLLWYVTNSLSGIEIQDSSPSARSLTEAMASRQRLLLTNFEKACEKFEADL
jgi:hypothetical protein